MWYRIALVDEHCMRDTVARVHHDVRGLIPAIAHRGGLAEEKDVREGLPGGFAMLRQLTPEMKRHLRCIARRNTAKPLPAS